ncbi:MAG: penicillin-binding transpeptidase domain-containing protein, partial [Oscillospiraceae bacterium]|nr:penicillin-binding transpeptidase domain-containing protein [Oscillospiraceae bacterium]
SGNAGSGAGSSGNAGGGGGDGGGGGGNAATGARVYPFKEMYAHVIGYNSPVYGKSRLESSFDDYLSGSGAVSSLLGIRDFIMGDRRRGVDLTLTLDHELQAKAYELLSGRAGAVVAIDPKTGEVLALASLPYFDPNESALAETWTTLQESENAPFLSRATMGLYSPGSTFKAVTAAAAVEKQFDGQMFNDNGSVTIDGRIFNNSQGKVNGRIDVTSAFAVSSNVVFSQLGVEIGEDGLRDIVSRFCIGTSIPFDIELTTSRFNYDVNEGMSAVDLASVGIGQGKLQVTPMQMALVAATIANGGVLLEPYLVKSADISMTGEENSPLSIGLPALNIDPVEIPRNLSLYNKSAATKRAVLSPDTAAKVRDMMIACVGSGTGRSAALSNISVAGKTGTAQNELTDRLRDKEHSWFIAFAPADDPKIAVAVILEYNGVSGGEACGPIARDIISQWLKSET